MSPVVIRPGTSFRVALASSLVLIDILIGSFGLVADEVIEGTTTRFDTFVTLWFRLNGDVTQVAGPLWLQEAVRDFTSLGSFTLLGFIVIASLSVVRAVADGRRAAYPWTLVLAFSAICVTFNVVHAAPTLVARLVAAVPPAALVLSFELLMRQLRAPLRPSTGSLPAVTPRPVVSPHPGTAEPRHDHAHPSPGRPLFERARDIYTTRRRAHEPVTGAVLARELGISDGYGRRLLRQLTTEGGGV